MFRADIDYSSPSSRASLFEKFPQADSLEYAEKSFGKAWPLPDFQRIAAKGIAIFGDWRAGLWGGSRGAWDELVWGPDILPRHCVLAEISSPMRTHLLIRHALRAGLTVEEIFSLTKIDPCPGADQTNRDFEEEL